VRKLRTGALARRTILAKAVYTALACGLAIAGWGLWSIVVAGVVQLAVSALTLWMAQPRLPRWRFQWAHARQILAYGWAVSAEAALWSLAGRAFVMMVGVVHGVQTLGYVNIAMRSTEVFSTLLTAVNARFALPLFSRVQGSMSRIRDVYRQGTELLNLASAPIFVGLSLTAADWVPLILGTQWLPAIPLIQAFSLAWAVVFSRMLVGDCVRVAGHPRALLPQAVVAAIAMVAAVLVTAGQSMLTVALAWVAARTVVTAPLTAYLLRRVAGLQLIDQARPLARPFICACLMSAAVLAARSAAPWGDAPPGSASRLAFDILIGAGVYLAAAFVLFRRELRARAL
jgi:O-antigen/teichoic acid export membrane protein